MLRHSWDQATWTTAGGDSNEATRWTAGDEAQSLVQNRGFATDTYVRGAWLGSGGWSRVYKVRRVADGRVFAGKSSEAIAAMRREAGILGSLHHAHVLKMMDWYEERGKPAATLLVTELCGHGTLQGRIDGASPHMGRSEMLSVVGQMGAALAYLHGQGLFHTDVKPRNMLVRGLRPMDVVLGDCGDARRVGSRGGRLGGTPAYYSPETAARRQHQGPGDDVWALGVALLGMAAQGPALRATRDELRAYPRRCARHAQALRALNPRHGLVRLLAGMLAGEPGARLSAGACAEGAARLLAGGEEEHDDDDADDDDDDDDGGREGRARSEWDLGIETPRDFTPRSFW